MSQVEEKEGRLASVEEEAYSGGDYWNESMSWAGGRIDSKKEREKDSDDNNKNKKNKKMRYKVTKPVKEKFNEMKTDVKVK